jgi:hypothetical protein
MIKKGKKTIAWEKARKELKKAYMEIGITHCEAKLEGCDGWGLSFAHRYKRSDSRCSHTVKGTILACISCHTKMEYDRDLTEKVFNRLRGLDE